MHKVKKYSSSLAAVLLVALLMVPSAALAHGGSSRVTDDAIINILQTPISPVAGEQVKTSYTFEDKTDKRLVNLPVKITLTNSFLGDESKDKEIETKDFKTDANGMIEFDYTFTKAGYFDTDLDFDVNDKAQSAGNLIQVRAKTSVVPAITIAAAGGLIVGLAGGWFIKKRPRSTATPQ